MPTYEYICEKCEHEFEREQRMSDPPVKTCPECRSRKVKKLISRTSFVLKGGGWYSDLYASTPKDKKDGKEGKGAETDSSSSEASESKTEGKTETSKEKKSSDSKKTATQSEKSSKPSSSTKGGKSAA